MADARVPKDALTRDTGTVVNTDFILNTIRQIIIDLDGLVKIL